MSEKDIDLTLVERVCKGDKAAFELLVAKYHRKVIQLISRIVRDTNEIEDIAQEAFIKAYRALPQFRGDCAFYTWLYRIALNTAKNYLTSCARSAPCSLTFDLSEAEAVKDTTTPESLLISKQISDTVRMAMSVLPKELRTAIMLCEIEGLSYEEIAQLMRCPLGTVRSRIFRAREAIAAKLRLLLDTPEKKRY